MGLIACPTCSKEVSDAAGSCPNCGHPIGNPTDPQRSERTFTTQATGKGAKGQQLLAVLLVIVGVVMAAQGSGDTSGIGGLLLLVGLVWWLAARIYAWWHYG